MIKQKKKKKKKKKKYRSFFTKKIKIAFIFIASQIKNDLNPF
jgi:hypothetical protein